MKRDQCLKLLAKYHRDEIVVPVYQSTFEWLAIKPEAPSFIAVGAMGQASSLALGLALGLPERRVIVLDGDGSLLMNLGSLVTIAADIRFRARTRSHSPDLPVRQATARRTSSRSWTRWKPRSPAYCARPARYWSISKSNRAKVIRRISPTCTARRRATNSRRRCGNRVALEAR